MMKVAIAVFGSLVSMILALVLILPQAQANELPASTFKNALNGALTNDRGLESARLTLKGAIEGVDRGYRTLDPTTGLSVRGIRTNNLDNGFAVDSFVTGLSLTQPIYDGGIASAELAQRRIAVDQARIEFSLAEERSLMRGVTAFIDLVVARERVALEEANTKRLAEYLNAIETRRDLGDATPTDVAATTASLARANARLIEAQTNLANAEEQYRLMMGLAEPALDMPALPTGLPQSALAAGEEALAQNHAHRLVFFNERRVRKALDVLTGNIRPKVDFTITGQKVNNDISRGERNELTASVNLTMPLLPTRSSTAIFRQGVADHRASLLSLIDSERTTRLRGEEAFRNLESAGRVINSFEVALEAAILLRDGTREEVQIGEKTVLDFLDTEQDVIEAQVNLLTANRDQIIAGFTLLAVVGDLSADYLGLDKTALTLDEAPIDYPITYAPLPELDYPETLDLRQ